MTHTELAALHAACFAPENRWSARAFASALESPGTFVLTASQGLLVGGAIVDVAELMTLAVHPAARRQGTARHLVETFEARAAALGAATAFLEVAVDNIGARSLYIALGYTEAGLRRGYYARAGHAPVDALLLRKSLAAAPASN